MKRLPALVLLVVAGVLAAGCEPEEAPSPGNEPLAAELTSDSAAPVEAPTSSPAEAAVEERPTAAAGADDPSPPVGRFGRGLGAGSLEPSVVRKPTVLSTLSIEVLSFTADGAGSDEATGPVPEGIDRSVAEKAGELRFCHQRELDTTPEVAGELRVRFEIDSAGRVVEASARESTLANTAVDECAAARFRRMSFAGVASGVAEARLTYGLRAGDETL